MGTGGASSSGGGGSAVVGSSTSTSVSTSSHGVAVSAVGAGGSVALPDKFTVSGVVTDGTAPVEGAIVMQAGGDPALTTGPDGAYSLELTQAILGTPTIVAAKLGYRTAGVELLALPEGPVELSLSLVTAPDNPSYVYGNPGTGEMANDVSTKFCGHCHATLVKQFQSSPHARATRDPLVQDLYAGVAQAFSSAPSCADQGGLWRPGLLPGSAADVASKCYLGVGVLPDLNGCGAAGQLTCDDPALEAAQKPKAFGRCADCHAPGINGPAGGRSLHEAVGIAFDNGNHCDVCHHVRDVDLEKPPGVAGALILQRPRDHAVDKPGAPLLQVMFGPMPDVPNPFMGGSFQPKFLSSELCGGCHEQKQEALLPGAQLSPLRWPGGLPTHSTYSEWAASSYNKPGTQCQFCHMPPDDTGLKSSLDVTDESNANIVYGFLRTPEQIRQHSFRDPVGGSPRLIDNAISLGLGAAITGAELTVTVKLTNKTAGHAIPTGEPMRSLLLLVRADACGKTMAPSSGMTLDDWGGAAAEGTFGVDATALSAALTWASGAPRAKVGDVVRATRPTGIYDDYSGIGFFADPALSPSQKGLEIKSPVGEALVVAVNGAVLTLSQPLPLKAGDRLYLGEPVTVPPADGVPSPAVAGSAGYSFARTLTDPLGMRGVPHYRATDIVSDNRIGPGAQATTTHGFAIPSGCAMATITAALIYRPIPVALARPRGWDARDYVVSTTTKSAALP